MIESHQYKVSLDERFGYEKLEIWSHDGIRIEPDDVLKTATKIYKAAKQQLLKEETNG